MCVRVCTLAGVGAVWVHSVSWSAGADEAGAVQVGALVLAQLLLTVTIEAKIWSQTTQGALSDTFKTALVSNLRAAYF